LICELADAYEVGVPPPWWWDAPTEALATMLELLQDKADRVRRAGRRR
jgi:hypothetical protein